jgi:hypothetical protein
MSTIVMLWRGQIPLATTAWFFGGLTMLLLVAPVVWLTLIQSPLLESPLVVAHSAFFLLYALFIAVAIWRSANNYRGWIAWRALAKGSVLVVFLNTAVQLAVI